MSHGHACHFFDIQHRHKGDGQRAIDIGSIAVSETAKSGESREDWMNEQSPRKISDRGKGKRTGEWKACDRAGLNKRKGRKGGVNGNS